jgi:hypothetical protein
MAQRINIAAHKRGASSSRRTNFSKPGCALGSANINKTKLTNLNKLLLLQRRYKRRRRPYV